MGNNEISLGDIRNFGKEFPTSDYLLSQTGPNFPEKRYPIFGYIIITNSVVKEFHLILNLASFNNILKTTKQAQVLL
jgi:hypothetical protein